MTSLTKKYALVFNCYNVHNITVLFYETLKILKIK